MSSGVCKRLSFAAMFALVVCGGTPEVRAQQPEPGAAERIATVGDLQALVWERARRGDEHEAIRPLISLPESDAALARLRASSVQLEQAIQQRETKRAEKLAEVEKQFAEALAKPRTPQTLSEALKSAIEMHLLTTDKSVVLADPRVSGLIEEATVAALQAEADREWLLANELFYRLNLLLEEEGRFDADVRRLGHRLLMIRLFVPERFWELRNRAQLAEGKKPLPPYNSLGEDYREKLKGVTREMVLTAVARSMDLHVDSRKRDTREVIIGALEFIRTMATTTDLEPVFPGIADAAARNAFVAALDRHMATLRQRQGRVGRDDVRQALDEVIRASRETVRIDEAALIREFGDGAMAQLDEFSGIIWPDEKPRFDRMTQGEFCGVGVQIQFDEETQMVKVITPLEGTPAQKAGMRAGDLIKRINGMTAVGVSIFQAVDLITGPAGSKVRLTVERQGQDLEFELARALIPLHSVKGWRRTGAAEDQWDWFVDPDNRIGYVRLTGFTPETTDELDGAIRQMQESGELNGLILDLRFNPGGLLTQAVSVASRFVPEGIIVSTTGSGRGGGGQAERAERGGLKLHGVPVVVLINEGSASASEIVAGAIKHYAQRGDVQAIVVGARTYGKGSVQNVWPVSSEALLKLTTQYYRLPDGTIIHRLPKASVWGVDPDVKVEMLPEQITDALKLRQDADVRPDLGENVAADQAPPDPARLITEGLDLQLQYALVLLRTKALDPAVEHVRLH
ncbi:MAG TPA: S41 family peptidase [Phycisphaerales bacterium]|nr:S41 family peptidase [Phycisphaerales bacterium]